MLVFCAENFDTLVYVRKMCTIILWAKKKYSDKRELMPALILLAEIIEHGFNYSSGVEEKYLARLITLRRPCNSGPRNCDFQKPLRA